MKPDHALGTSRDGRCRSCGVALAPDSRFCTECGIGLPSQGSTFCIMCGTPLEESAEFCLHCGAVTIGPSENHAPPLETVPEVLGSSISHNSRLAALLTFAFVVVAIGLGVGWWLGDGSMPFLGSKDGSESDASLETPEVNSTLTEPVPSASATTIASTTKPRTEAPSTTAQPAPAAVVSDAEPGLGFDVGVIWTYGEGYIDFDRYQLCFYECYNEGPEFIEEPTRVPAQSDAYANQNPRLRTYPVSPAVEVLLPDASVDQEEEVCSSAGSKPKWVSGDIDQLEAFFATQPYPDPIVGLTFGSQGEVVRIRVLWQC